jgi:type I restriction enzyme S subunit
MLDDCWPIDTTYFIRVPQTLEPKFLSWQLTRANLRSLDSSTAVPSLRRPDLEASEVIVAPRGEQTRIVAAIEKHFSHLDAAEAALATARRRLTRFEEVVYGEALTQGPLCRLGDVVHTTSGGTPKRSRSDYFGGPIPWIKSGELGDGVVTSTEETITEEAMRESSAKPVPQGTVLIAMYGATIGKLGRVGVPVAATNQAVAALFADDGLNPDFLWNVLRALRSELVSLGQGGAQPNISQTILRDVEIPVPPLGEQLVVNARIEQTASLWRALTQGVQVASARATLLRRSILAAAFSGHLVPRDHPDDEPASALPTRIRAERVSATASNRRRKAS